MCVNTIIYIYIYHIYQWMERGTERGYPTMLGTQNAIRRDGFVFFVLSLSIVQ